MSNDYTTNRDPADEGDPADERDSADPRYCPPNLPRVWSGRVAIADERVWHHMRELVRQGDNLEAELATLRAHQLMIAIAARKYLACYPAGRLHGRDGRRAAEALVTALEEAGL